MKDIRNLKKGDIVTFKDGETIADVLAETGKAVLGQDLRVENVLTINQSHGLVRWTRVHFTKSEKTLIIKEVEDLCDVRICSAPESFECGDRQDLDDSGWLEYLFDFEEEQTLTERDFLRLLSMDYDNEEAVEFKIKGGVLYGEDKKGRFCGVAEWSALSDTDYPEVMAIEIGGEDSESGGYIELYQGINMFEEEYEVL